MCAKYVISSHSVISPCQALFRFRTPQSKNKSLQKFKGDKLEQSVPSVSHEGVLLETLVPHRVVLYSAVELTKHVMSSTGAFRVGCTHDKGVLKLE